MSTTPAVATAPAAPIVDDKEFIFTFVLNRYNAIDKPKVYSPWHSFAGFRWRLLIFPRGNQTKHELSVYLECGGPVVPEASDKRSVNDSVGMDHSLGRHSISSSAMPWSRAAHFWLHLVHPSRWGSLEIQNFTPELKDHALGTGVTGRDTLSPTRAGFESSQAATLDHAHYRLHPTQDIIKDTVHVFRERESDWGFCQFAPFSLLRPGKHSDDNYNIIIKVRIRLEDCFADPIPHNVTYDSRKETGYVGFKNQGATCYMNSLLQTLYMLTAFRRAVYDMPLPDLNSDNSDSDMSYALQKVFYELQFSPTVVKTKKLTESFGWESTDSFTQHDVQELNRILCDHLEEKMKKLSPDAPNTISQLFQGKILNYIECTKVDYKSTREESFYDLSLNVKGCRNIIESFQKYTEVEMMDGDNKYRADDFEELQEARKGVRFLKLPPALQLHLKRFEYDFARDAMVKINDRYEFDTEIDLSPFVENSDGSDVYLLHSVLVHIGDVNGGHYHAFIRPHLEDKPGQQSDKWYQFDDEAVKIVTEKEAVNNNFGFGGEKDMALINTNNGLKRGNMDDDISNMVLNGQTHPTSLTPARTGRNYPTRRFTNAYMLQYLRKDRVSELLKPCLEADIPPELAERINRERKLDEQRKKERAEQHLYMLIAIATERDLYNHCGGDLVDWEKVPSIRVKRALNLGDLKRLLQAQRYCRDAAFVRLWKCTRRQNDTIRPDVLVADGDDTRPMSDSAPRDMLHNNYTAMYNTRHYDQYIEDTFKIFVEDFLSPRCFAVGAAYEDARVRMSEHNAPSATGTTAVIKESASPISTENEQADGNRMDADGVHTNVTSSEVRDKILFDNPQQKFCRFPLKKDEVLLFFKLYVSVPPSLHWFGHAVVDKTIDVNQLLASLKEPFESFRISNPEELLVYEELTVGSVSALQGNQSLQWQRVNGGDIIVFQPPLKPELAAKIRNAKMGNDQLSQDGLVDWDFVQEPLGEDEKDFPLGGRPMPTVRDFYSFLAHRIKIEFKNKWSYNDVEEPIGICLELLRRDSYLTVRKILANAIGDGADAEYLRLYPHDIQRQGPAHDPVRIGDNDELLKIPPMHMLSSHLVSSQMSRMDYRILWYEQTEYPLSEIEQKEEVRVFWRGDGGTKTASPTSSSINTSNGPLHVRENAEMSTTSEDISLDDLGTDNSTCVEKDISSPATTVVSTETAIAEEGNVSFSVLVPHMSKYQDVIDEIKKRQKLDAAFPVRLLDVKNCRIYRIIDPSDSVPHMISSYDYPSELRAEPVPADETPEALGDEYQLISVVHMARERHRGARHTFFGVPFILRIRCFGQSIHDIRELIRVKLGVAEQEFNSWRLAEVMHHKVEYLDDPSQVWNPGSRNTLMDYSTLAIEHRCPTPTRRINTGHGRFADKPLKIRG